MAAEHRYVHRPKKPDPAERAVACLPPPLAARAAADVEVLEHDGKAAPWIGGTGKYKYVEPLRVHAQLRCELDNEGEVRPTDAALLGRRSTTQTPQYQRQGDDQR